MDKACFVSMGILMHCDLKFYCVLFSLPEGTQSQSSNPKHFKESRIWRGRGLASLLASNLLALVTAITSQFIRSCLGVSSSSAKCIVDNPKFF